jgi:hypothetical protein
MCGVLLKRFVGEKMSKGIDLTQPLTQKLAGLFSAFPAVRAIGLAGSQTSGAGDGISDIDLYVYTTGTILLTEREALVQKCGASRADLNLTFWDLGDEWFDAETGIEVDVIYWDCAWIGEMLDRVLVRHEASVGYTTCFWHTLCNTRVLYDPSGWLAGLVERAGQPYPEELRRAIVAKNYPLLRQVIPSYVHQIEKAVQRGDWVSVNHRTAALLASYFDVLFALNRVLNPGEKRLVSFAVKHCARRPSGMEGQIEAVLCASAPPAEGLLKRLDELLDGLDGVMVGEGF